MTKSKINLITTLLIPICIAINIVAGQLSVTLKLPIFLDTIGTILIAMVAGPFVGGVTGLLSNVINSISDPTFMPFAIAAMAVGIAAGLLAKKDMYTKPFRLAVSIVVITIVSLVISIPIVLYVFGGVPSTGSSMVTAFLLAAGQEMLSAVLSSQVPLDLLDKTLSTLVALFIVGMLPDRYLIKLPLGQLYINSRKAKKQSKATANKE